MTERRVIFGFEGLALTGNEKAFFKEVNPWGYIVFARNIDTPEQTLALTQSLRELSEREDVPVLIDQEGGRVARMRPPHWPKHLPGGVYGEIFKHDRPAACEAARLNARLLAYELSQCGINVNCIPMLDIRAEGSCDNVIGDRAFSGDPLAVSQLGRATTEGLLAGGVMPVIKHLPGHGRSVVDSHESLPVVDASLGELEASDFVPFRALNDQLMGMTGHLIFKALDESAPSTWSKTVIDEAIRSKAPGRPGFDGLLLTDDLSMGALGGDFGTRTRKSIEAGCDIILHCNGDMAEMQAIAGECPLLAGKSQDRADAIMSALAGFSSEPDFAPQEAWNRLQQIIMAN